MLAPIILVLTSYIALTCPFVMSGMIMAEVEQVTKTNGHPPHHRHRQQQQHHHQRTYLDVKPVNTTWHLEVVRALNITTYRLSYDRDPTRVRIGAIGPQLPRLVPDAVDLVTLPRVVNPSPDAGGEGVGDGGTRRRRTTLADVPVVDDHTLFMYGIGATKELAVRVEALDRRLATQIERVKGLFGETTRLEDIVTATEDMPGGKAELRARAAEAEATKVRLDLEIEIERMRGEEDYAEARKKAEITKTRRNEELALERFQREDESARVRAEEELKMRFEASQEAEQARMVSGEALSAAQYERDLTLQKLAEDMKAKTAKSIAKAKADAERANEDVHLRKLKAEAEQRRRRNIAAINAVAAQLASSLTAAVANPKRSFILVGYIVLFATGLYTAKEIARLCRALLESLVGRPKLVRETTRKSPPRRILEGVVECVRWMWERLPTGRRKGDGEKNGGEGNLLGDHFGDVILPPNLKDRILSLATSARAVRRNRAPHRHVLFYGPPGTGKTLVARKMAKCVGMEYAFMSGGDVGPLGVDAVTQIHGLFAWAGRCRKGLLLFVDEAEAFLGDRRREGMNSNAHNALNALLYHTGSERTDFMMVLATNRAEDLDAAILDRCDETLLFPRPNAECRLGLITHYFDTLVRSMEQKHSVTNQTLLHRIMHFVLRAQEEFRVTIQSDAMDSSQTAEVVQATGSFSGREIAKLMIALQGIIYASRDGVLTRGAVRRIVETKVAEHKDKRRMVGTDVLCPTVVDVDSVLDCEESTALSFPQDHEGNELYHSKDVIGKQVAMSPPSAVRSLPIVADSSPDVLVCSDEVADDTFSRFLQASSPIPSSQGVAINRYNHVHGHDESSTTLWSDNIATVESGVVHTLLLPEDLLPPMTAEGEDTGTPNHKVAPEDQEEENECEENFNAVIDRSSPPEVRRIQSRNASGPPLGLHQSRRVGRCRKRTGVRVAPFRRNGRRGTTQRRDT